jgi:hypothetical protein
MLTTRPMKPLSVLLTVVRISQEQMYCYYTTLQMYCYHTTLQMYCYHTTLQMYCYHTTLQMYCYYTTLQMYGCHTTLQMYCYHTTLQMYCCHTTLQMYCYHTTLQMYCYHTTLHTVSDTTEAFITLWDKFPIPCLHKSVSCVISRGHLFPPCSHLNTFTATVDHSGFNNSCLKMPVSTLVDLIFQSCSFSLNQLTCHYRQETCTAASVHLADIAYIATK